MKDELHAEVASWPGTWPLIALAHVMIDLGRLTVLECQMPDCHQEPREFRVGGGRGDKLNVSLDHIVPQRENGSHRIENLRLVHLGCNSTWRRGLKGSYHTDKSREVLRQKALEQHRTGRGPDYSDPARGAKISAAMTGNPVRDAKISAALTGKMSEPAKRGWETRRANLKAQKATI